MWSLMTNEYGRSAVAPVSCVNPEMNDISYKLRLLEMAEDGFKDTTVHMCY